MKKLLCVFILLFSTVLQTVYADENDAAAQQHIDSVPNPLELEKGWWEYFEVSATELPKKIDEFKNYILDLEVSLDAEEHKEILEINRQIISSLELLEKKKKEMTPSSPAPLKLLKKYTISQLFEVQENVHQTLNEIKQITNQVDSQKVFLSRSQLLLDKQILHYHTLSRSSYNRLLAGMRVIETRAKIAIYRINIQQYEKNIEHLTKKKKYLNDELLEAKKKLTFHDSSLEGLDKELKSKKSVLDDVNDKYFELEKIYFQKRKEEVNNEIICCFWDYQIFTQRVRIEEANLAILLHQLEMELFKVVSAEGWDGYETFKSTLNSWKKKFSETRETLEQWQKKLDEEHANVSKFLSKALKEKKDIFAEENAIKEVHLELDKSFALLQDLRSNIEKAELLHNIVENRLLEKKSLIETWLATAKNRFEEAKTQFNEMSNYTIFRVKDHPVTLGLLIKAFLIMLFGILFSHYFRKFLMKRNIVVRSFSKSTEYIVLRFIHYGIILISLLVAFGFLGFEFRNIAIVAGALGVGIGFGLQSMVNNILSGFMLLLNRYLKVGDIVEVEKELLGKVIAVNLQNTQIEVFDGANIIIPNFQLASQKLVNWTMYNTRRRFRVPFRVAYSADKDSVRKSILESVKKLPFVIGEIQQFPNPEIWFKDYGERSIDFELVTWVDLSIAVQHGTARSSLLWEIDNILRAEGIHIPFQQQDIYVKEFPK